MSGNINGFNYNRRTGRVPKNPPIQAERNDATRVGKNVPLFNFPSKPRNVNMSINSGNVATPRVRQYLSQETINTNNKQYPRSSVSYINIARTYLNKIVEVDTMSEYNRMSKAEQDTTQMKIIEGLISYPYGNKVVAAPGQSWCAWSVSSILKSSGIKSVPVFSTVDQYVLWGNENKRYVRCKSNNGHSTASGIKEQLPKIKQGDLIIFKAKRATGSRASHIGIIEFTDINNGTITVLEGNNKGQGDKSDSKDGYVRRVYTISELVEKGYSGYIKMAGVR